MSSNTAKVTGKSDHVSASVLQFTVMIRAPVEE